MEIWSLEFFFLCLGVYVLLSAWAAPLWRKLCLLGASLYFLQSAIYRLDPAFFSNRLVLLAAFLTWGYVGYDICLRGRKRAYLALAFWPWFALYIALYLLITKSGALSGVLPESVLRHFVFVVGTSYILLRQLHVCFDVRNGMLERVDPLTYITYLLSFHTLLAGPIMRYQDFSHQIESGRASEGLTEKLKSLNRIATGLVKKFVVAAIIFEAIQSRQSGWGVMKDPYDFWIAFHFFAIYEYMDFSGYCDIMIGIGELIGVRVPENFNRPYFARNMIDFWSRWHITLADWIHSYVFNPVSIRLARVLPQRRWTMLLVGFTTYTVAFMIVGLWHNISWGFFLWGLAQGVALGVVKVYDSLLRAHLSRKGFKKYLNNKVINVISTLVTVEYFICSVGFVLMEMWGIL